MPTQVPRSAPLLLEPRVPERLAHPHALRAYWATRLLEAGVPVHEVSARLGHVDLRTTARYAAPRPERVDEIAEVLDRRHQAARGMGGVTRRSRAATPMAARLLRAEAQVRRRSGAGDRVVAIALAISETPPRRSAREASRGSVQREAVASGDEMLVGGGKGGLLRRSGWSPAPAPRRRSSSRGSGVDRASTRSLARKSVKHSGLHCLGSRAIRLPLQRASRELRFTGRSHRRPSAGGVDDSEQNGTS